MTGAERKIERLLAQAHRLAWGAGRYDVTVPITQAINVLRRYIPRRLPDSRDDDELDRVEEALAHGVNVRDLNP